MSNATHGTDLVFAAAAAGDSAAWGEMLLAHQDRLCRMTRFRLDPRLYGRVDALDVVQEVYAEATAHRERFFAASASTPLFLWLRGIAVNKLLEVHRHHLGTRMRDAAREVGRGASDGDDTSVAIVAYLSGGGTGPGTAAARDEVIGRLRQALDGMDEIDREVLALRHFEQLSGAEAAQVLGIQERAAAKRYVRALGRLRRLLAAMPGGLTGIGP